MSTTLATQVRSVFQAYAEGSARSNGQQHLSVFQCWQITLETDELFAAISCVQRAVAALSNQVKISKVLDNEEKSVAREIVAGLQTLLQIDHFPRHVLEFKTHLSTSRLGTLGMLAKSLIQEFPEAILPSDQIEALLTEIEELASHVEKAGISDNLKFLLLRHLKFMIWALRNLSYLDLQTVYDDLACLVITANRLPEREGATDQEPHPDGTKSRVLKWCGKLYRVLKVAENVDDGVQVLEHLKDAADTLLDVVGPL
jgi:hypothetical protein